MATYTPTRSPEDSEHGEESPKPQFPIDQSPGGHVYDDQKTPIGDPSDPRGPGPDKVTPSADLKTAESQAGSGAKGTIGAEEKGLLGKAGEGKSMWNPSDKFMPPSARAAQALSSLFTTNRRKKTAAGGVIVGTVGLAVLFFSIAQGPLQFVHFAQLLQKFHFSTNEDFGDNRSEKLMIYAMAGATERGRLGAVLNSYADRWERKMLENTGLRPIYTSDGGRQIGYEIFSDKKDRFDAINDVLDKNPALRTSFDRAADSGVEILSRSEVLEKDKVRGTGAKRGPGKEIDPNHFVIYFGDTDDRGYKERRLFTRSVSRAVVGPKIAGAMSARVLEKRGGVSWHILNNAKRNIDNRAAAEVRKKQSEDYEKNVLKRWATLVKSGVSLGKSTQTDKDGKNDETSGPDTTPDGEAASEEANKAVEEVKKAAEAGENTDLLRNQLVKGAGGAAIAVGVFCAVKDLGNSVEDVKYTNNVLPMMRMGTGIVSIGNQVMSGDDFNLDEMGAISKLLNDKEKGTSWTNAESIRAELGQEGGEKVPDAAKLSSATEKPRLFQIVDATADNVPGLGLSCDAFNAVAGFPIIREVSGFVSSVGTGAADAFLGPTFGTSVEELTNQGLAALAGESVNPLAKGAEFGNLTNTGAFLAANEQAVASGGRALTEGERQNVVANSSELDRQEFEGRSLLAKLFDPYDHRSLSGSAIDRVPNETSQFASIIGSSLNTVFSGKIIANFLPKAKAASTYDYGEPKYGFSLSEQNDDLYENPYENGLRDRSDDGRTTLIKLEADLPRLNEKYGTKCFGTTVTTDDKGVHIQTDKINRFKVAKDNKDLCDPTTPDNRKDRFNQYRMYIADAMTAVSLACYEGDETACSELGFASQGSSGTIQTATQSVSGDLQELAQQMLDNNKITYWDVGGTAPTSKVVKDLAAGKKAQTTSSDGPAVAANQAGGVDLNPNILKAILEYAQTSNIMVNALTDKDHGTDSPHYRGIAVDFECKAVPFDTAKMDTIAKKYGGARNGETCAADAHWHYDFPQ